MKSLDDGSQGGDADAQPDRAQLRKSTSSMSFVRLGIALGAAESTEVLGILSGRLVAHEIVHRMEDGRKACSLMATLSSGFSAEKYNAVMIDTIEAEQPGGRRS